jgi:2-phospho-L-lactate/phosphoenolpyruvate guanylyltransferase
MPRSDPFEQGASPTVRAVHATRWCLVVPVKRLGLAKTRLGGPDVPPPLREKLALAFAADMVSASFSASRVADILVVTDDPQAAEVLGGMGATIIRDEPDAGLNAAFMFGAAAARQKLGTDIGIAACTADLPALRGPELDFALAQIGGGVHFFVADAHSVGTTMLFAPPGVALDPHFGGPSRAAHIANGAVEVPGDQISSLRRDVDTAADLADALVLGVGPHTAAVRAHHEAMARGTR